MTMTNRKQTMLNDELRMTNEESGIQHSTFNIRHFSLGIFGTIKNPLGTTFGEAEGYASVQGGLGLLITNLIKLTTVGAGIWFLVNLITAGVMYIGSNGETEKITIAWAKIWQSLIGLLIIVGSLALTAIISKVFFGNYFTILNPVIYGPGTIGGDTP